MNQLADVFSLCGRFDDPSAVIRRLIAVAMSDGQPQSILLVLMSAAGQPLCDDTFNSFGFSLSFYLHISLSLFAHCSLGQTEPQSAYRANFSKGEADQYAAPIKLSLWP